MRSKRLACHLIGLFIILFSYGAVAEDTRSSSPKATVKPSTLKQLISQLGHNQFDVRDAASQRLLEIGESAIAALKTAAKSDDAEIRIRATGILAVLTKRSAIQCAYNDAYVNYRVPKDNLHGKTLVTDLFFHEQQQTRWKVTRTDKGHVIQVTSGACRGWYFEFDNEIKPFLEGDAEFASCLRLNKELTERAYWMLTKQEERNAFFIQPMLGKFKDWYLDIYLEQGTLLLSKEIVPGAYWIIGQIP